MVAVIFAYYAKFLHYSTPVLIFGVSQVARECFVRHTFHCWTMDVCQKLDNIVSKLIWYQVIYILTEIARLIVEIFPAELFEVCLYLDA